MPEYLSPGVYVEEIDAGPKPIEGVSTSTAGAVGVTSRGTTTSRGVITGKPELVTSFAEFTRKFGGYLPEPDPAIVNSWALNATEGGRWWQFPLAVKGFFDNGGQRLYVRRVFSSTATDASVYLGQGIISEITQDVPATSNILRVRHLIGINADPNNANPIQIFVSGASIGNFEVTAYRGTGTIELDRAVGQELKGGRDFIMVRPRQAVAAAQPDPRLRVVAKASGDWGGNGTSGNGISARVRPMVGATLKIMPDPSIADNLARTTVRMAANAGDQDIAVADITGLSGNDRVLIAGAEYTIVNVAAAAQPVSTTLTAAANPGDQDIAVASINGIAANDGVSIQGANYTVVNATAQPAVNTTVAVATNPGDTDITLANIAGLAVNDVVTIQNAQYTITAIPAGPNVITINPPVPVGQNWAIGDAVARPASNILRINPVVPAGPAWAIGTTVRRLDNGTLRINPVVPAGPGWAAGTPVRRRRAATASTMVAAEAAAGSQDIEVASVANLNNSDRVLIDGGEYTISNRTARAAVLTATTAAANAGTQNITVADTTGLANGDQVTIAGAQYTIANLNAGAGTFDIAPVVPAGQNWAVGTEVRRQGQASFRVAPTVPAGRTWAVGTVVRRLRPANTANAGSTINVRNASQLYAGALVELDNGTLKEVRTVESVSSDTVTLQPGNLGNAYFEDHKLRVIEAEVGVRYRRDFVIEAEEVFSNLRLVDDGSLSYFVTHVNTRSTLIDLEAGEGFSADTLEEFPSVPPATAPDPERYWADLTGGADNLNGLTVDDFVGVDGGSGNRTGIQALEDIDEISLCLAPGIWSTTVHNGLIQHCEILKDRFAILDPQDGLSIEGIREVRETIDTKYAALYYPWIEVRDPSVRRNVYVAPSGHMAGIYARVDVERGVHKAPANEVIRGITKIAQDVTKREQDLLNPRNINALRFFPGRGNRVWGARTLSSDASWKYINVRRLFIFVEESIDEGTQWVVFEPNAEPLWARVTQTITNFLTTVWRSGALEGTKADQAFFVRCDRTTMTQDDIDNGRLICLIGIAPVKPAEFVIFRIQQKTLETRS